MPIQQAYDNGDRSWYRPNCSEDKPEVKAVK